MRKKLEQLALKSIPFFCFLVSLNTLGQDKTKKPKPSSDIIIQWVDSLPGDFGFVNDWGYNDNIFKNEKGQLICDGNCPPRAEGMKDAKGNIFKDSLKAYYKLIDTTHYYYSLQCDAWCYEYFGTHYITCFKSEGGFINCHTPTNVATHSSLRISISGDKCFPLIYLTSIVAGGTKIFKPTAGTIKIDKTMLAKGYLKAEFDFKFLNTSEASKPIYWKGKIFCVVNEM